MIAYINGSSCISPQNTFLSDALPAELVDYSELTLRAIDPSYKDYLDPKLARRMGRVIKMGIACGMTALKQAELTMPDAVITGTGMGCIEDTERFLAALIENDETMLTPTNFIQSTHNTIGGQIALMLGCKGYNFAYVNTGFSFETALIDALLGVSEGRFKNVLVGGIDEITPNRVTVLHKLGMVREEAVSGISALKHRGAGAKMSEGAGFFVLSSHKTSDTGAALMDVKTIYRPKSHSEIIEAAKEMLERNHIHRDEVLLLTGMSGDAAGDQWYDSVSAGLIPAGVASFKVLSGEGFTVVAMGMWVAVKLVSGSKLPSGMVVSGDRKDFRNVLIYNHFNQINHSLTLVSGVE